MESFEDEQVDDVVEEGELLRYHVLEELRLWSVADPAGCRRWLGPDAEQILAMIEDQRQRRPRAGPRLPPR